MDCCPCTSRRKQTWLANWKQGGGEEEQRQLQMYASILASFFPLWNHSPQLPHSSLPLLGFFPFCLLLPPSFHTPLWPSVLSQEQKHSRHIWHRSVSQSVMTDQRSYVHPLRIHTSSIHFSRTRKRTKHKSMNNEGGYLGAGDMNMCTMHTMHTVYTMDTIRVSMVNCFVFFCCPIPC